MLTFSTKTCFSQAMNDLEVIVKITKLLLMDLLEVVSISILDDGVLTDRPNTSSYTAAIVTLYLVPGDKPSKVAVHVKLVLISALLASIFLCIVLSLLSRIVT